MRNLLRLLPFIFAASFCFGTAAVSGKLTNPNPSDTSIWQNAEAHLDLHNCGNNYPTVPGASVAPHQIYPISTVDGTWSGTVYRNDEISCGGVTSTTWWTLTYWANGRQVGPSRDLIISQPSLNLDNATPITTYPPPTPPAQPLSGAESVVCAFPVAASTWTCAENMGTQQVVAEFFDLNSKQIFPDTAQATDINTFVGTFLQPQAGFMRVVNVGNWTPSVLFPNYIIANPTSSQSINTQPFTFNGPTSFLGASNAFGNLNAVLYVGGTIGSSAWGSADIGTQIQTAYNSAQCPIPGCRIHVLPGSYSTATAVTAGAAGKRLILEGDGIGVSVLNYTGSGTFLTFNNTLSSDKFQGWGSGIRDLDILGPGGAVGAGGNAGVGVLYGGSNFQIGFFVLASRIAGFTTNLERSTDSTTWGLLVQDTTFISCGSTTKNVVIQHASENNLFLHNVFTGFCTAVANPGDVTLTTTAQARLIANSFDNSGAVYGDGSGGQYTSIANTYEMGVGITNATADIPIVVNGGQFTSSADEFRYDSTSNGTGPPAEYINCTAGNLDVSDSAYVHSGVTIATFINAGISCTPVYQATTFDPASNGFSTAITQASSTFFNRFANGSISTSGNIVSAGKFCGSTNATCASGSAAGDGSFARSATTGTIYWGSDGNMFLSRTAAASATFNFAGTVHNNGTGYVWGDSTNPWSQIWMQQLVQPEISAPAGAPSTEVCYGDSTSHTLKCSYNNGSFFNIPQVIGSGTAAMTTGAISSLTCGSTVTVSATGVATTDAIAWAFNAAPAANPGELVVSAWPTANNVNFQYCNPTAGSVTPNAATLNWRVTR